jgi:putative transcriptional regulator
MKIRLRLENLLEERGRSLYWLAKEIGAAYNHLHRFKSGAAASITFDMLGRICEALECEPGDLFEVEDSAPVRTAKRPSSKRR